MLVSPPTEATWSRTSIEGVFWRPCSAGREQDTRSVLRPPVFIKPPNSCANGSTPEWLGRWSAAIGGSFPTKIPPAAEAREDIHEAHPHQVRRSLNDQEVSVK